MIRVKRQEQKKNDKENNDDNNEDEKLNEKIVPLGDCFVFAQGGSTVIPMYPFETWRRLGCVCLVRCWWWFFYVLSKCCWLYVVVVIMLKRWRVLFVLLSRMRCKEPLFLCVCLLCVRGCG